MSLVYSDWREAPEAEFGVIGDPISHTLSPAMHQAAFSVLGLSYRYLAIRVSETEFEAALKRFRSLGYRGLNVTVPLKVLAFSWASLPEPRFSRLGAMNTLELASGRATNTDVPGFIETLKGLDLTPGATVLILGAGGSARAAAWALVEAGYKVKLYTRRMAAAQELVQELSLPAEILEKPDPGNCQLIINATSAGLKAEAPELLWDLAQPQAWAYDLSYARNQTPFLEQAFRQNLRIVDGMELLVAQGSLSLEWWLGLPAPREVMREAIYD